MTLVTSVSNSKHDPKPDATCILAYACRYPYKQQPLEKQEDVNIDQKKPHLENLCEKCMLLGYNCKVLYSD